MCYVFLDFIKRVLSIESKVFSFELISRFVYQYISLTLSKIDFSTFIINITLGKDMSEVVENTPEIVLASRWSRVWAFVIDGLIYAAAMIPVALYTNLFDRAVSNGAVELHEQIMMFIYGWVVFLLCHGYLLQKKGQTIGKNVMEIAIVDMDGKQIGLFNIVIKRILPMSIFVYIPVIGQFISILNYLFVFRKNRRCLHDLIAGTQVVSVAVPRNLDFSTIK